MGKDNVNMGMNATLGNPLTAYDPESNFIRPNTGPILAFDMQAGLGRTTDLLIHADQHLNLGGGIKQQLWGGEQKPFAGSIGVMAGINLGHILASRSNTYLTVPLYTSYDLRSNFSLCFTPRYLYQRSHDFVPDSIGSVILYHKAYNRFGLSYGFLWGREVKFGLEISHFAGPLFQPSQISVGFVHTILSKKNK